MKHDTHSVPPLTTRRRSDSELSSARTSFSMKFKSGLWILTTGSQFVIGWWYRKAAVFYLPPGWFGPMTWWLALPFAPAGSVSCGVWQMACRRVIKTGERVVKDVMAGHTQGECSVLCRHPLGFPWCRPRLPSPSPSPAPASARRVETQRVSPSAETGVPGGIVRGRRG